MTEKCSLSLCSTASAHKQMTPWLPVESLGAGGRENAPIEHLKTRCKMPLLENLCLLRSTFTLAPPSNDTVGAAPAFWIRRGQLAEESEEKGSDCQLTLVILGVRRRRRRRRGGEWLQSRSRPAAAAAAILCLASLVTLPIYKYMGHWDNTISREKNKKKKKWRHSICKAGLFHTAGKTFSKGS